MPHVRIPQVSAPNPASTRTKPGPGKTHLPKKKRKANRWRPAAPFNPPMKY